MMGLILPSFFGTENIRLQNISSGKGLNSSLTIPLCSHFGTNGRMRPDCLGFVRTNFGGSHERGGSFRNLRMSPWDIMLYATPSPNSFQASRWVTVSPSLCRTLS
ncbi:unnamed protein product [Meganyctiphanes norvegica]|uniref:Uncharacterized protein n=1 Tax=Meganyctiphanes norvegica TaxID=48144 RepID=A0AAV2SLT1_MEGNR